MAKMKTPKHNFPEGKTVICNEKITLKNYKKLFSKCLKANIRIGESFMMKPICKDYIYFGWDGYKISRYYKDNDLPKVSIEEFNSFFNHKKTKEKTYKIKQETVMDSITINDVKYIKEDTDSYKITREQILSLKNTLIKEDSDELLKTIFPEEFET